MPNAHAPIVIKLQPFVIEAARLDDSGSSKCSSASKPFMDPHDLVIETLLDSLYFNFCTMRGLLHPSPVAAPMP